MIELKTDWEIFCNLVKKYPDDVNLAEYNLSLKQEAIKWVKYLEKIIVELEKNIPKVGEIKIKVWCDERSQIEWIIHFFNITEEDLK